VARSRDRYNFLAVRSAILATAWLLVFPFIRELSYSYALFAANLISLQSRRHDISKSFFPDICDPSSCTHQSPPPPTPTRHFCFIRAQNSPTKFETVRSKNDGDVRDTLCELHA